jgi:hypothetical protein
LPALLRLSVRQGSELRRRRSMAVAAHVVWPGFTAEQYDQLRDVVGWEREVPPGATLHIASFSPEGAHIVDVWESEEAVQRFIEDRVMPGAEQVGIPGQPEVRFYPVHALFTPGF